MKELFYLFISILLFSCSQPKEKSGKEIKTKQTEVEQVENDSLSLDDINQKKVKGSSGSLTCDCTCSCNGNVFTLTVYPCKNQEVACERECNKKCQ